MVIKNGTNTQHSAFIDSFEFFLWNRNQTCDKFGRSFKTRGTTAILLNEPCTYVLGPVPDCAKTVTYCANHGLVF